MRRVIQFSTGNVGPRRRAVRARCAHPRCDVAAAWEAFSSPTSMAALEILIGTWAMRDTVATQHLSELRRAFAKLGRHIGEAWTPGTPRRSAT